MRPRALLVCGRSTASASSTRACASAARPPRRPARPPRPGSAPIRLGLQRRQPRVSEWAARCAALRCTHRRSSAAMRCAHAASRPAPDHRPRPAGSGASIGSRACGTPAPTSQRPSPRTNACLVRAFRLPFLHSSSAARRAAVIYVRSLGHTASLAAVNGPLIAVTRCRHPCGPVPGRTRQACLRRHVHVRLQRSHDANNQTNRQSAKPKGARAPRY